MERLEGGSASRYGFAVNRDRGGGLGWRLPSCSSNSELSSPMFRLLPGLSQDGFPDNSLWAPSLRSPGCVTVGRSGGDGSERCTVWACLALCSETAWREKKGLGLEAKLLVGRNTPRRESFLVVVIKVRARTGSTEERRRQTCNGCSALGNGGVMLGEGRCAGVESIGRLIAVSPPRPLHRQRRVMPPGCRPHPQRPRTRRDTKTRSLCSCSARLMVFPARDLISSGQTIVSRQSYINLSGMAVLELATLPTTMPSTRAPPDSSSRTPPSS